MSKEEEEKLPRQLVRLMEGILKTFEPAERERLVKMLEGKKPPTKEQVEAKDQRRVTWSVDVACKYCGDWRFAVQLLAWGTVLKCVNCETRMAVLYELRGRAKDWDDIPQALREQVE